MTPASAPRRAANAAALLAATGVAAFALPQGVRADTDSMSQVFAVRIDADNVDAVRVGGPDAIAGVGDWAFGNGTLCAAVSDIAHESVLSPHGGLLIDLGHCARGNDQFSVLQPMVNLSRDSTLPVAKVRASTTADVATISVEGDLQGVRFETVFTLDRRQPTRLGATTTLERIGEGDSFFLFGDVSLHGHRQLAPYSINTVNHALTIGFEHPHVDTDDYLAMAQAVKRDNLQVLVGGGALDPGISYGWWLRSAHVVDAEGGQQPLDFLSIAGEHFSIIGAYSDTLFFGGTTHPGLLEMGQTLLMDLEIGDRIVYVREIIVGDRADVGSVTDQIWTSGPLVRGQVRSPDIRIRVTRSDGVPTTFVRPDSDGAFSFRLPPGKRDAAYALEFVTPTGATRSLEIEASTHTIDLGLVAIDAPGLLNLPRGEVMRLVFVGADAAGAPTPTPRFGGDGYDYMLGDRRIPSATEANFVSLAGVDSDPSQIEIAPGRYRVLATRGPEWSVSQIEIQIREGTEHTLAIEPPIREVEPGGWVSADLHVHSALSDDSALPVRPRIAAFMAQGAEIIVATEHDQVIDYAPYISEMGLAGEITSIVGSEITSTLKSAEAPFTIGHANAFPLRPQPTEYRNGAPNGESRRLRSLLAELRAEKTQPMLQLNHPREGTLDAGLGSYYSHLAVAGAPYDPSLPLTAAGNSVLLEKDPVSGLRDLDYHAVELLNGPSMERYRMARADWLSLMLQGEFKTGTGNSDSHSLATLVALPRNYVSYARPEGEPFDERRFFAAVRAGQLYATTGPLLSVRLGDAGPGGMHSGRDGVLRISVRAASWVPVSEARIYVDAALVETREIRASGAVEVPLRFDADGFITVEIVGDASGEAGEVYRTIAPGFTPFAFSNPIRVDHDADGQWRPPGMPESPPITLTDPVASP